MESGESPWRCDTKTQPLSKLRDEFVIQSSVQLYCNRLEWCAENWSVVEVVIIESPCSSTQECE